MSSGSTGHSALSADVVAAIDDLELAARVIVEGLRTGGNRSPFHGVSTEFRQYRAYRPGDDLRHLDWKLYGRSNRLYTRQFRETTNLSVMLVLDTSSSMAFPDRGVSKFRYASILAAALAYLVSTSGNAVGLMTMTENRLTFARARGGRPHLHSLIARIDSLKPDAAWNAPVVINRAAQLMQRRGVIIVISDFYDQEEETLRSLRQSSSHGHDVAALQILSPGELRLPWQGQVELEDLESGVRRLADGSAIAEDYRQRFEAFLERIRTGVTGAGIDYALMTTDSPPEISLRDYIQQRTLRSAPGRSR